MLEISNLRIALDDGVDEKSCLAAAWRAAAKLLRCAPSELSDLELRRRSIDARKKRDVHLVCTVRAGVGGPSRERELIERLAPQARRNVHSVEPERVAFPSPVPSKLPHRPVVVGAGCAGLFAALALAEAGLEPLLIERGDNATRRADAIDRFERTRVLDPESNIQFGLGGAGTFSDGKLTTGTKNPAHRLILETFVAAGAPRAILWDAKPHIGSDILPRVVTWIVARIRELGGEVRFRTRLVDIERDGAGAVRGIAIKATGADGESAQDQEGSSATAAPRVSRIACERLVLACGHSARDVFELLERRGFALARKTFAMGVRIEHRQAMIDRAQYGPAAGHPALGAAPYKLVAHPRDARAVFSFCMCPGGTVVAATSEEGCVVTNGASEHARADENANAALLVNVLPNDLPGTSPLAGVELQRQCERAAFEAGGGDYRAPAQLLGDFLAGSPSTGPGAVRPTYPLGVTWTALDALLPCYVTEGLLAGIPLMERQLKGFTAPDAVLTGVETRSSSPVTVRRSRACEAEGAPGVFPCGEGAGYAGGIMSAATDGIRCAEALIASLAD